MLRLLHLYRFPHHSRCDCPCPAIPSLLQTAPSLLDSSHPSDSICGSLRGFAAEGNMAYSLLEAFSERVQRHRRPPDRIRMPYPVGHKNYYGGINRNAWMPPIIQIHFVPFFAKPVLPHEKCPNPYNGCEERLSSPLRWCESSWSVSLPPQSVY